MATAIGIAERLQESGEQPREERSCDEPVLAVGAGEGGAGGGHVEGAVAGEAAREAFDHADAQEQLGGAARAHGSDFLGVRGWHVGA